MDEEITKKFEAHDIMPKEQAPVGPPNTQWQYLIVTEEGAFIGTNSVKVAKEFAVENISVLHVPTCQTVAVLEDGTMEYHNVPEQTSYELN